MVTARINVFVVRMSTQTSILFAHIAKGWQRFGPSGDLGQKKFRDLGQISQKLASFGQRFGPNY